MWEYGTYTPYENPYNIEVYNTDQSSLRPAPKTDTTTTTTTLASLGVRGEGTKMPLSTFHSARQILRAGLIACLLVFGHVLVGTILSGDPGVIRSLGPAIRSTSALVFLTLLWQAFGLLEQVDMPFAHTYTPRSSPTERHRRPRQDEGDEEAGEEEGEGGEEVGEGLVFGMTWVEFIHNAVLLGCWTSWSDGALMAYTALRQTPNELGMEFIFLPLAAIGLLACLALMQAQLCFSITHHAWTHGFSTICTTTFWTNQTGHWTQRLLLDHHHDDEREAHADSHSSYPAEKVELLV